MHRFDFSLFSRTLKNAQDSRKIITKHKYQLLITKAFQKPNYKNLFKIFNSKKLPVYECALRHMFGQGCFKDQRNSMDLSKVLISGKAAVWEVLRASFTPRPV